MRHIWQVESSPKNIFCAISADAGIKTVREILAASSVISI